MKISNNLKKIIVVLGEFLSVFFVVCMLSFFYHTDNFLDNFKNLLKLESSFENFINNFPFHLIIFFSIIIVIIFELIKYLYQYSNKTDKIFWGIVFCANLCIFGEHIIGKKIYFYNNVGFDTHNQYYPYFVNEALKLVNGSYSVWNWDFGLGASIVNSLSWVFDPFAIITVIMGVIFGVGKMHYFLVWMQMLKICAVFILSKIYLKNFFKDRLAINIAAFLISFNGYLLLWGQHYFLGTACFFAILIFCEIEYYLKNKCMKGGIVTAVTLGILMIYSYYIGYMILLVSGIYFLYRYFTLFKSKTLIEILKDYGNTIYIILTGICLSGVVFIPGVYYITNTSSRLKGNADYIGRRIWNSFIVSFNFNDLGTRISRFLSNNMLGINDNTSMYFANYYETPQFFCTLYIFFIIGIWFIKSFKEARENKNLKQFGIKIFLLYLLLFNSFSALVLNGFSYSAYRYTYLVFPFLGICIADTIENIRREGTLEKKGLAIGLVVSILGWIYSYNNCSSEVKKYVFVVLFLLVLGVGIYIIYLLKKKSIYVCTLVALLIVTNIVDNIYTTNNINACYTKDYIYDWRGSELDGSTKDAINWIRNQDASFYRIGKTYSNWNPVSDSFFEEYSTSAFYCSTLNYKINEFYDYIFINGLTSMESVKYFSMVDELDQQANNILNTKYILSKDNLSFESWELINSFDNVNVYKNKETDSIAKGYVNFILKNDFEKLSAVEKANILKSSVVVDNNINFSDLNASDIYIESMYLRKPTELYGNVRCDGNCILSVSVPDQDGWEIYVDGKAQKKYNTNYGFIGVYLESGTHEVIVKYRVPYVVIGTIISIVGLFLLGILAFGQRKIDFSNIST